MLVVDVDVGESENLYHQKKTTAATAATAGGSGRLATIPLGESGSGERRECEIAEECW